MITTCVYVSQALIKMVLHLQFVLAVHVLMHLIMSCYMSIYLYVKGVDYFY